MSFLNHSHTHFLRSQTLVVAALALVLLSLGSNTALAQGPPPNMDVHEYKNGGSRCHSTGRAFTGNIHCDVAARIRDGRINRVFILLRPDTPGPYGLKEQEVFYNVDYQSHRTFTPRAQWYNVNSSTKRLVLTGVRATQEFRDTATYSIGTATVEITFTNGEPGNFVVNYTHQSYKANYGPTRLPSGVRAVNGTIFSGRPLNGRRLYYELL